MLEKNNIALISSDNVKQLLSPLSSFNISYFAYTKAYIDGSRARLTSNAEHLKAWFEDELYLQGNANAKIDLYESQAALTSTLPNQYPVKWSEDYFNIAHGIHLIRKHDDYCEFFMFASTPKHPEVVNLYLNHLDILQNFCDYFKLKAADLLIKAEQQKIVTPFHNNGIKASHPNNLEQINQELKNQFKFTKRQQQCITLLLKGSSTKSISSQLELSTRTVEHYIDSIKAKLLVRNKAELIIKLVHLFGN